MPNWQGLANIKVLDLSLVLEVPASAYNGSIHPSRLLTSSMNIRESPAVFKVSPTYGAPK